MSKVDIIYIKIDQNIKNDVHFGHKIYKNSI